MKRRGNLVAILLMLCLWPVLACGNGGDGDLLSNDTATGTDTPGDAVVADDGSPADSSDQTDETVSDGDASDTGADQAAADSLVHLGPRVVAIPPAVDFAPPDLSSAGVDVQLHSNGDMVASVTGIVLEPVDGTTEFALDFSGSLSQGGPTPSAPLILPPGATATFRLVYTPASVTQRDPTGWPAPDRAAVRITYDGIDPVALRLTGRAGLGGCPVAVMDLAESDPVPPQTIAHLSGARSVSSGAAITEWKWTVEQPSENKFLLVNAGGQAERTHEANVVGAYRYHLDVCNGALCSDAPQCMSGITRELQAAPPTGIHCELTWDTPADTDQYDAGPDRGSDLDLHVAHSYAIGEDLDGDGVPDGWFDIPYDVFWFNRTPEWESVNPNVADNGALDRDDTDGAGPENFNLVHPVDTRIYRVGVHYWDTHGFGTSKPLVKCYINGALALDATLDSGMVGCDMWEVASIEWPSGQVTPITNASGGPKVYPAAPQNFVVSGGCQ